VPLYLSRSGESRMIEDGIIFRRRILARRPYEPRRLEQRSCSRPTEAFRLHATTERRITHGRLKGFQVDSGFSPQPLAGRGKLAQRACSDSPTDGRMHAAQTGTRKTGARVEGREKLRLPVSRQRTFNLIGLRSGGYPHDRAVFDASPEQGIKTPMLPSCVSLG
jgi:hypothetical protein